MYNLAKNIATLRINKKFTQKELAEKIGVSKATITSYEDGSRTPPIEKLEKIAEVLNIKIELFFKENLDKYTLGILPSTSTQSRIPIISHASAGKGIQIFEAEILGYIELPEALALKCDFATYVTGNSMEPKILDGDIVCVKENSDLENGEIGIFCLNEEIFIKKYKINPFTSEISLISLNPHYKPIIIKEGDSFKTIGKVICKFDYNF